MNHEFEAITSTGELLPVPGPSHVFWPPERFFWALLDAPGVRVRGQLPVGLTPGLQEYLSNPVDAVHAVCAPVAGDRVLVCAARRADLASLEPGVLYLTPGELPPFATDLVTAGDLNLLVGEFEPTALRVQRRRQSLMVCAAAVVCTLLICIGLVRRINLWQDQEQQLEAARVRLVRSVASGDEGLRQELSSLRKATGTDSLPPAAVDSASGLAALLRRWPAITGVEPRTITVTAREITLSVELEGGEPREFLETFAAPAGWMLGEPRLSTSPQSTVLNLELRRAEGKPP
ncbi:hypothetical protein PHYC_01999 [Phycisphaerales bacterium]|nr:hypothetical protein PHYC_01999 [Phycisphaerales bacterium]